MEMSLRNLGIRQSGDIRNLIESNNNLPYNNRDIKLSALYELIVEYNASSPVRSVVKNAKDAYDCLAPYMKDLEHEEVWVIFLNRANKVLKTKKMFRGGIDSSIVDNRIIIKEAIMLQAVQIIIAHNHPSGLVKPSKIDIEMTKKLKYVAEMCDIRLLDHIIISGNSYYSMSDENGI